MHAIRDELRILTPYISCSLIKTRETNRHEETATLRIYAYYAAIYSVGKLMFVPPLDHMKYESIMEIKIAACSIRSQL